MHTWHTRVALLPNLQVLQHEIRKTHAKSQRLEWIEELQLMQSIGKGGFGVVYRGTWKGSVAAVKVGGWGWCGGVVLRRSVEVVASPVWQCVHVLWALCAACLE